MGFLAHQEQCQSSKRPATAPPHVQGKSKVQRWSTLQAEVACNSTASMTALAPGHSHTPGLVPQWWLGPRSLKKKKKLPKQSKKSSGLTNITLSLILRLSVIDSLRKHHQCYVLERNDYSALWHLIPAITRMVITVTTTAVREPSLLTPPEMPVLSKPKAIPGCFFRDLHSDSP